MTAWEQGTWPLTCAARSDLELGCTTGSEVRTAVPTGPAVVSRREPPMGSRLRLVQGGKAGDLSALVRKRQEFRRWLLAQCRVELRFADPDDREILAELVDLSTGRLCVLLEDLRRRNRAEYRHLMEPHGPGGGTIPIRRQRRTGRLDGPEDAA